MITAHSGPNLRAQKNPTNKNSPVKSNTSTEPVFLDNEHENVTGINQPSISNGTDYYSIPFEKIKLERDGMLGFISVFINGKEGIFLIDTGASVSIFNSASMERFELNSESQEISNLPLSGMEGTKKSGTPFLSLKSLQIGNILVENYSICLVDLNHITAHLAHAIKQFDGILGGDFLNKYCATISYEFCLLHLKA